MIRARDALVSGPLRRLLDGGSPAAREDAALLDRFANDGDGFAFEALVARHGPRVLSVCRRSLRDPNDVDDAFQATFLVLVRRAGSLGHVEDLGPWLGGVAAKTSRKIRAVADRRRAREAASRSEAVDPGERADLYLGDGGAIDEELARLPARYRDPIVVCLLEGHSRREAAGRLGLAEGTISSRISRGKSLLQRRLARRGLAPPASIVPAVTPRLLRATLRAAQDAAARRFVGAETPAIASYWKGIARMLNRHKFQVASSLAVALATIGAGSGFGGTPGPRGAEEPEAKAESKPAIDPRLNALRGVWLLNHIALGSKDGKLRPGSAMLKAENVAFKFDASVVDDHKIARYGRASQGPATGGVIKLVIEGDRIAYMIGDVEFVSSVTLEGGKDDWSLTLHPISQGLVGGKKTPDLALVPRDPVPRFAARKDLRVRARLEGDSLTWDQELVAPNREVTPGPTNSRRFELVANRMVFRKFERPGVAPYLARMEPDLHPERHPKRETPDEPAPKIDADAFRDEAEALKGTWVEISMGNRAHFQPMLPGTGGGLSIRFEGPDAIRVTEGEAASANYRYRIGSKSEPREIDLFRNRPGSDRVEVIRALYRVRGELLTLAISDFPDRRPTGLSAGVDEPQSLIMFRRIDGPKPEARAEIRPAKTDRTVYLDRELVPYGKYTRLSPAANRFDSRFAPTQ